MAFKAKVKTDHHTAMRVRDLDGAIKFYVDVVGLEVLRAQGDPNRPSAVFLPAIQLVRAADGEDTSVKGTLDHVGLIVQNIEEIVANLEKHGVQLERPISVPTTPGGARTTFFRDPENNRIELVQRG